MQALHDIFAIFGTEAPYVTLATALNEKKDTVYKWLKRKRIPESAWMAVIEAARQHGRVLTVADMHAANAAPRVRRKSHRSKASRRRRDEVRA